MTPLRSVVLLLVLCGCNWGTRPKDFLPALGPEGARVALRVLMGEQRDRVGELIAVDSIGITVRGVGGMKRTPWADVVAMDVDKLGADFDIAFGERPSAEKRARLALISRFPQGLLHLAIKLDSLIADASRSTTRLADQRVAIAEGYHRVGADFPGMGEHWVSTAQLLSNRIDPAHPTILIYATIGASPRLLGVGFMIVTRGDTSAVEVPGWPDAWHEHSGLLADESVVAGGPSRGPSDTHVWVMHAWTVLPNADGVTAANNWALPYARAGLPLPEHADEDAGRALALQFGGDAFVRDVLTDAGFRTPRNALAIDSVLAAARARITASHRDSAGAEDLSQVWRALAISLEQIIGTDVTHVLAPSHHAHRQ